MDRVISEVPGACNRGSALEIIRMIFMKFCNDFEEKLFESSAMCPCLPGCQCFK